MTGTSKEANLERVPCIRYPVRLRKDQDEVEALLDSGSEVNAMHPAYAAKLGLRVRETDVGAQKIDGSHLDTFGMVIAGFSVEDKLGKVRFFQETFLLANISLEVVLGMPFSYTQQCGYTLPRARACLENLHSCRGFTNNQTCGDHR